MVQTLNTYSTIINIFLTIILLCITAWYAVLTRGMLQETINLRKIATEPEVSIYLQPSNHGINLVVQNIGNGTAYDISFDVSASSLNSALSQLSDQPALKKIAYMAPNQKFVFRFAYLAMSQSLTTDDSVTISAVYYNKQKNKIDISFLIDPTGLERALLEDRGIIDISNAINNLTHTIEKIRR